MGKVQVGPKIIQIIHVIEMQRTTEGLHYGSIVASLTIT